MGTLLHEIQQLLSKTNDPIAKEKLKQLLYATIDIEMRHLGKDEVVKDKVLTEHIRKPLKRIKTHYF